MSFKRIDGGNVIALHSNQSTGFHHLAVGRGAESPRIYQLDDGEAMDLAAALVRAVHGDPNV